jgi:type IV secretory pathway VirB2 component (pilin)
MKEGQNMRVNSDLTIPMIIVIMLMIMALQGRWEWFGAIVVMFGAGYLIGRGL